jgi:hypothetical protein
VSPRAEHGYGETPLSSRLDECRLQLCFEGGQLVCRLGHIGLDRTGKEDEPGSRVLDDGGATGLDVNAGLAPTLWAKDVVEGDANLVRARWQWHGGVAPWTLHRLTVDLDAGAEEEQNPHHEEEACVDAELTHSLLGLREGVGILLDHAVALRLRLTVLIHECGSPGVTVERFRNRRRNYIRT